MESLKKFKRIFTANEMRALQHIYMTSIVDMNSEDEISKYNDNKIKRVMLYSNLGELEISFNIHSKQLFDNVAGLSADDSQELIHFISQWFKDCESKHKTPEQLGFILEKEYPSQGAQISQFAIDNQL